MTNLKKDIRRSLKHLRKISAERFKLLVIIFVTLGALAGGGYGLYYSLMNGVSMILIFLVSVVWIWFGIGMLDMFRDMVKFNK
tara:strand:- start:12074 stop:12322 length:249 start_codon:yes stop_codon:yes gene_type:complete